MLRWFEQKLSAMKNTEMQKNIISTQQKAAPIKQETPYSTARNRQLAWMKCGFDMGTKGKITWTREDLYER